MKNQKPFDKIIEQVVKEDMDNIELPDMKDVWGNIESRMKNKRKSNKGLHNAIIAAVLVIVSANIFLFNDGYANYFRTLKFFSSEKDDMINIQIDNKTPGEKTGFKGDIPPNNIIEHENGFTEYIVPLDMAKNISDLSISEPSYIPEGFEMGKVSLMEFNDMTFSVALELTSEDKFIEITIVPMPGESVLSVSIDPSKGAFREEYIRGYRYYIIEYDSGDNEIIWDIDEIKYKIRSNVSIEEILKVASLYRK